MALLLSGSTAGLVPVSEETGVLMPRVLLDEPLVAVLPFVDTLDGTAQDYVHWILHQNPTKELCVAVRSGPWIPVVTEIARPVPGKLGYIISLPIAGTAVVDFVRSLDPAALDAGDDADPIAAAQDLAFPLIDGAGIYVGPDGVGTTSHLEITVTADTNPILCS